MQFCATPREYERRDQNCTELARFDKSLFCQLLAILMSLLHATSIVKLVACFATLCFAGDIITDSIVDALGEHCAAQTCPSDSQHEKTPCSHCSCAVHNGSVIALNNGVHVSADVQPSVFILIRDEPAQVGSPAAIDHPPQLA
jgi:hypothetical protein